MKTVMTFIGARPQFVKAACLSRVFAKDNILKEIVVHSGQHYDHKMSDRFFEDLEMQAPDIHLSLSGGGHGDMTGRMLIEFEKVLQSQQPDLCLVYGDTNTTIAAALAASKLHIPVAHIESGLRSFNRRMPEEINRIVTDQVSDFLFCPTENAVLNLANEGIVDNVLNVGDIMYDAVKYAVSKPQSTVIEDLGVTDNFAVLTLHRQENTQNIEQFKELLDRVMGLFSGEIIFPVHPRIKQFVDQLNLSDRIRFIDPVGYFEMQALLAHSSLVLTDSGGLQKEAYFHKKKCITLREETEWVELIESGWNKLINQNEFLAQKPYRELYGSGNTAQKIADALYINIR